MSVDSIRRAAIRIVTRGMRRAAFGTPPKLFDDAFYRRIYPEVERSGIDPYLHYIVAGSRRGYDPAPDFSTAFYVRQSGATWRDPLKHYGVVGIGRGLDPHPHFSTQAYLARYPDVRNLRANPLLHYRKHGKAEKRVAEPAVLALQPTFLASQPSLELTIVAPDLTLALNGPLTVGSHWRLERRLALRLHLKIAEFEQLQRCLRLGKSADDVAIRICCSGSPGETPGVATALLVFDDCFCLQTDGALSVRYAEARLWDVRTSKPQVVCVDTVGSFVCRFTEAQHRSRLRRATPKALRLVVPRFRGRSATPDAISPSARPRNRTLGTTPERP